MSRRISVEEEEIASQKHPCCEESPATEGISVVDFVIREAGNFSPLACVASSLAPSIS